jgi:calcyphosin
MNATRQEIVDLAFNKFDKDGCGVINSEDLRGVYDCSKHPKVVSGVMTADQVFVQFLKNFGCKGGDGLITRSEWNDNYAAVSAGIDNCEHFASLMKTAWRL